MRRAAAFAALAAAPARGLTAEYLSGSGEQLWSSFKKDHARSYATREEEAHRRAVFMANMEDAVRSQAGNPRATFGPNKFADMTGEEFKVYHALKVPAAPGGTPAAQVSAVQASAPQANIDWRAQGAVTSVKDQAQCGSCWSFSTTGGIEGAWKVAGHSLVAVSEQELVSCDKTDGGCDGGLMSSAFQWLISNRNGGIVSETSYPYTSGSGSVAACQSVGSVVATITGYQQVGSSESSLASALQNQPISIAVDASAHWQTYSGGVVSSCTGQNLDHGVLLVGVTSDYWIVKNSWGPSWGESGYIRLAYGSNQCGLSNQAAYPTAGSGPAPPPAPGPSPPAPSPPGPSPPASGCTWGSCGDCGQGCYDQYGYEYSCCYGDYCCCYAYSGSCDENAKCPGTYCSVGAKVNGTQTACRVASSSAARAPRPAGAANPTKLARK